MLALGDGCVSAVGVVVGVGLVVPAQVHYQARGVVAHCVPERKDIIIALPILQYLHELSLKVELVGDLLSFSPPQEVHHPIHPGLSHSLNPGIPHSFHLRLPNGWSLPLLPPSLLFISKSIELDEGAQS